MALIKCKECSSEVSSKAESCPKCGFTIRRKISKFNLVKYILLCILLCILAISLYGQCTRNKSSSKDGAMQDATVKSRICEERNYVSGQLRQVFEKHIKASLKAPTTAKFDNYNAIKGLEKDGSCVWTVEANVTSQNSFGALLTKPYNLEIICSVTNDICMPIIVK